MKTKSLEAYEVECKADRALRLSGLARVASLFALLCGPFLLAFGVDLITATFEIGLSMVALAASDTFRTRRKFEIRSRYLDL
jgi:hypothetical protein